MQKDLAAAIEEGSTPAGDGGIATIGLEVIRRISSRSGLSLWEVERAALENGVVPVRYLLNIGTIGIAGQLKLLRSCVGICGLGGLGGFIVELLARFGFGHLVLVDGDVFEEDNLNRQLPCTEAVLGRPKVEVAAERVTAVNPSLQTSMHQRFISGDDVAEVFSAADLVIDALDNVPARLVLEEGCARLGIPMVHGAISGNSGQVMTVFPGDPGLTSLYAGSEERGPEALEGNPPTTPALVASLQVQEAVKIICGGDLLRHGLLLVDTAANLYQFIPIA